jgi:hypothetical protein
MAVIIADIPAPLIAHDHACSSLTLPAASCTAQSKLAASSARAIPAPLPITAVPWLSIELT